MTTPLIQVHLPVDATEPGEFFAGNGAEPAYHEVYAALADAVPTWTRLAAHRRAEIRSWAVVLLAAAPGEAAARALRDRLTAEPERGIRAEILLGLALHEVDADTCRTVERHLADDDPLLRFCAALTWVRKQQFPADAGAPILVEALCGDLDATGFGSLYLGEGDPTTDAATLALLPPEQAETLLAGLCAALDEVNSIDAVSVANALLDIVFPTEAYGDGEPLTGAQRTVIRAPTAPTPGSSTSTCTRCCAATGCRATPTNSEPSPTPRPLPNRPGCSSGNGLPVQGKWSMFSSIRCGGGRAGRRRLAEVGPQGCTDTSKGPRPSPPTQPGVGAAIHVGGAR
ncbi:hypothetical protein [Streptomyces europaeiscabiei]|uniref:hypothetical protein n=1 Tax=Streptomyces europaeiscabiei TaxID=146819 RepID=UPI0038F79578